MLTIHLWAGLTAALFLFALGVSGSLVAFETEIDHALNPRLTWIHVDSKPLAMSQMIARLKAACPGYEVAGIEPSPQDNVAWSALLTTDRGAHSVAFNPYTGGILGDESERNDFIGTVHQFHTHLLAGKAGGTVATAAAVFLLLLAITGLVLWWPRKLANVSWRSPWKKLNLEAHQVLGLYTSAFLMAFAITAVVIHWDDEAQRLVNRISGSPGDPQFPDFKPLPPNQSQPHVDAILAAAQNAEPDARVTAIFLDSNPVRVIMKHPEDRTPFGRTNVLVDAFTGSIVLIIDWRTGSPGLRLVKVWNREIHTGDVGGLPTRILACVVSLSLPIMTITGPLIWWHRRRRLLP